MEKTNKKTLEEIIRVDHAGERGAIKIYEGQLLALKTFKQNASLKRKIEEMKEHEREHYEYFDNEIKKRNIQPTKLLPLWDLMGVTLGFGTAMLGEKAAMLCTASVEEVIDGHYKDQTYKLGKDEEELKKKIMKFRQDELDHKDIAYDNGATKKGLFGEGQKEKVRRKDGGKGREGKGREGAFSSKMVPASSEKLLRERSG